MLLLLSKHQLVFNRTNKSFLPLAFFLVVAELLPRVDPLLRGILDDSGLQIVQQLSIGIRTGQNFFSTVTSLKTVAGFTFDFNFSCVLVLSSQLQVSALVSNFLV